MKILFRNSKKWTTPNAVVYNSDESEYEKLSLSHQNDDFFELAFDELKYNHFCFTDNKCAFSGKIYPGNLSIGVEYKFNENLKRDLTYLCSKNSGMLGRVENYELLDPVNLSYRNDKSKKISVLLPQNYDGISQFDVLYFFDAQNLFCQSGEYTENGDPYGSWQLDIVLDAIHHQFGNNVIVVGIDNADEYRSRELFMNPDEFGKLSSLATAIPEDDFSKGYLDCLSNFIVGTLHSFIKEKYVIKEDNIGIGGSSMGGIAAFYCGIKELKFYNYVLSYSPAFGLYEMNAFENYFVKKDFSNNMNLLPKIHIYCGGGDMLEQMLLPSSMEMKSLLIKHGYDADKILETYDMTKPHNEESWRQILPQSFSFLLR